MEVISLMGRLHAEEMKDMLSLDEALAWHLQSNHYPRVPLSMVPVCKEAIEHANVGDWNTRLQLPPGISFYGETTAPVLKIVEQHHLETFLEVE
jgi:hypothetical protein